jgi:hypothetical protein
LAAAGTGEGVELCHSAGLGWPPLLLYPALLLQTVQGRVWRTLLDPERFSSNLLDALGDRPAVFGFERDRLNPNILPDLG